jgi:DNA (cytosine-5)-methyltransferase 1
MQQLVLSLFPGADLFGRAFEQEGFTVVHGPDILLGGDIRNFHVFPQKFDGIIGGPPCQSFSQATLRAGGSDHAVHGNLIPEFERIVIEAKPRWYVMENVRQAPLPFVNYIWSDMLEMSGTEHNYHYLKCIYYQVTDAWACGASQHRLRRFSSNLWLKPELMPELERHPDPWPTVTATEDKMTAGTSKKNQGARAGRKVGRRMTLEEVNEAMGLPKNWETPALTVAMQYQVRGNGVELHCGRTIARAVKQALES